MLIDTVMVTQLPPGSVSTLRYAYRINDLPIQIVIMSISRAIFPFISSQAIEKDYEGLRWVFKHSVTLLGLITLPLISLIALFSHDVVAILLERGAFDSFATQQTAETLVCYGVGLFFASYAFVNGAFFSALKDTKPLLYLGFLSMLLNIAFNFIFMRLKGLRFQPRLPWPLSARSFPLC
jgi:putative peptidoglycan lipid II flippase